jgi:hypothetical protein
VPGCSTSKRSRQWVWPATEIVGSGPNQLLQLLADPRPSRRHEEPSRHSGKVGDEAPNRRLPPKPDSERLVAKQGPESRGCERQRMTLARSTTSAW